MQPEQDINESGAPPIEQSPAPVWKSPGLFSPKPDKERVPFWSYLDLLLLTGLMSASVLFLALLTGAWVHFHPSLRTDPAPLELPFQFAVYFFVYLCFLAIFKLRYDRGVWESLGWRNTHHNLIAAGLGGAVLYIAIGVLANLIHTPKVDTPFDELGKTPWSMVLLAVTAVFLAPLFEEMVFRGFLQPLLSRTFGVALGISFTALLFGGLHAFEYKFAWQYVAAITLVGIALGTVRAKTNSIIPGTVMHGCFNAVSLIGLLATKYTTHK